MAYQVLHIRESVTMDYTSEMADVEIQAKDCFLQIASDRKN